MRIDGLWLAALPARAASVYYHDPDVNLTQAQIFQGKVMKLLKKIDPEIEFRAFGRLGLLREAMQKDPPDLVMVPPYLARELGAESELHPILIRERKRSSFVEIVIVGKGTLESLRGQTLAASGVAARPTVLDGLLLTGTAIGASDFRILEVKKDVDAVLAAGRGQVAGACVYKKSLDLVAKANPTVGDGLNVIHTVAAVPLSTLCTYGKADPAAVAKVQEVFGKLHKSRNGKKLLRLLKADKMVEVTDELREKLK
ncbi:MAG: PhnD/SsuA/transferrin family substrate-binding protein [Planctomycetota bacterium]